VAIIGTPGTMGQHDQFL